MSPFEAASSIIIEFDMENDIFGLPRELVVASAGRQIKSLKYSILIVFAVLTNHFVKCYSNMQIFNG